MHANPLTAALVALSFGVTALAGNDLDHTALDRVLTQHVDAAGYVDYNALAKDPSDLDAYIQQLAEADLAKLPDNARLATLINAYNAFTLRLILDHYNNGQLVSIMDIPEDQRWKAERWNLGGQTVSLDGLEHGIIRKQFDEPRFHWAVVCAAVSCPPLRREAYTADKLDQQLAEQEAYVMNFNHPRFAQRTAQGAAVTKLIEWYGPDFGDGLAYTRKKLGLPANATITFIHYEWALNSKANKPQ